MMSVFPHVNDLDGLRETSVAGRALGFVGRTAIHPRQLATIVECFTSTAVQVAEAEALLAAVEKAGCRKAVSPCCPTAEWSTRAMVGRAREITTLMREIESRQS